MLSIETSPYYYRARYYDPASGRFLGEDPIRFAGDGDFYRYAGNNPVLYGDPFGLWTGQVGISGGGAFGGWSGSGSVSIAVDGQGNVGLVLTYGGGWGHGAGLGVGLQGAASNAATISDLSGPFAATSVTGGEEVIGSADYFHGPSAHGQVTGVGGTIGLGGGAFSSVQLTNTMVIPLGSLAHPPTSGGCPLPTPPGGAGVSPLNYFLSHYVVH